MVPKVPQNCLITESINNEWHFPWCCYGSGWEWDCALGRVSRCPVLNGLPALEATETGAVRGTESLPGPWRWPRFWRLAPPPVRRSLYCSIFQREHGEHWHQRPQATSSMAHPVCLLHRWNAHRREVKHFHSWQFTRNYKCSFGMLPIMAHLICNCNYLCFL